MKEETLCALCSAPGRGACSLLRLSGPESLKIIKKLAPFLPKEIEPRKVHFGTLKEDGEALDQVLLVYFKEGQSFTGEEVVEISCHGGGVYQDILKACIKLGARPAGKGEFSMRAFLNGKMDLTQAEALLSLIESESKLARKQALFQLKGGLSKKFKGLEKKWLFLLSHIEADIDFSQENLNVYSLNEIKEQITLLIKDLELLLKKYQPFDKLQKGLSFGIFGNTNAGKSSLFNKLLEEDKAIVSKEEGTTRDLVEGTLKNEKGIKILLKDSAGFRETRSDGEKKGQEKSKNLFLDSDYRLMLVDGSSKESPSSDFFRSSA